MHPSTLFVVCLLAYTVCHLTRSVTSLPTEPEEEKDDVVEEKAPNPSEKVK